MIDLLQDNIYKICNTSAIKTFGIILYNEENPNIIKLLRDDDYWRALDRASGEKFIVFSIKPKKGSMEFPQMPPGVMGMMVPMWKEPNSNNKLLEQFKIKSTQNLPMFFVFTKVDEHLLMQSIKIDETNVDTALIQLKNIFQNINNLTEIIHSEYNEHEAQVHSKIAFILKKYNAWVMISSTDSFFKVIKKYLFLLP